MGYRPGDRKAMGEILQHTGYMGNLAPKTSPLRILAVAVIGQALYDISPSKSRCDGYKRDYPEAKTADAIDFLFGPDLSYWAALTTMSSEHWREIARRIIDDKERHS